MTAEPGIAATAADLRRQLADRLEENRLLRSPQWRAAIETVPRHVFVPRFYRESDDPGLTTWEPITPEIVGQEEWLRLVYTDETWMTQFEGRDIDWSDPQPISNSTPTSSSTLPSLVVRILQDLGVQDGMTVLEIGTGTGYSTALMCHRLGDEAVTSIETDEGVARRAREALHQCGWTPRLLVADGRAGEPEGAPYDRLIATCGLRNIPPAWLEQVRPGGVILTTLRGWMRSLGLVKLVVTGDSASGWFSEDDPSFMIARQQDAPENLGMIPGPEDGTKREAEYGPEILTRTGPAFMTQLAAPDARFFSMSVDGGPVSTFVLDSVTDSFAVLTPSDSAWQVRQGGSRRLWDAVESAVSTWQEYGSPNSSAFGVTVSHDAQMVWLGSPNGPRWPLPS
ncbi:ATP-grasp peptide maturase system methyltransferase [Streptomyces rugosispiralis]|uniref:Protein-L-isoaspartate O-methyltransferase n=1 Tax=Streptomyces rugosispiralis TaxID=2967341 RepID=A0ABT1VEF2_9ACTN|nr:ATP-grasp peptide maturase system methyltransferase [Streptomyces rugosispiralis]MCQ8195179.1 ATP-grasp peptide maturase system methyltransferase [Streptomyces rugosispiralis]